MSLNHISYSQYSTYTRCPRSWYLGKLKRAQEKQTWYLPIGTAFHQMIEDWMNPEIRFSGRDSISAESYFYPLIRKQMEIEPDTTKWLAGGTKNDPVVRRNALQQVKDCFERALEYLEDIDVWEVEYDASGPLPGLEVPVHAYVDLLGEHKKHGPVIADWKTGKQKPKDNFQLETYAALLQTGSEPRYHTPGPFNGLFLMAHPSASVARPVSLADVDPAAVGAKYQKVYEDMKAKLYKTNQGYDCKNCFQQENCLVKAGPTKRAKFYDRSAEEGIPF